MMSPLSGPLARPIPLFVIIMLRTGSSLFHLFDKVKLVAEPVPLACSAKGLTCTNCYVRAAPLGSPPHETHYPRPLRATAGHAQQASARAAPHQEGHRGRA